MSWPGGQAYGQYIPGLHGWSGDMAHPAFCASGVTDTNPLFVGNWHSPRLTRLFFLWCMCLRAIEAWPWWPADASGVRARKAETTWDAVVRRILILFAGWLMWRKIDRKWETVDNKGVSNCLYQEASWLTKVCTRRAGDDCKKECGEKDSQRKVAIHWRRGCKRMQEDAREGTVLMLTVDCTGL